MIHFRNTKVHKLQQLTTVKVFSKITKYTKCTENIPKSHSMQK